MIPKRLFWCTGRTFRAPPFSAAQRAAAFLQRLKIVQSRRDVENRRPLQERLPSNIGVDAHIDPKSI